MLGKQICKTIVTFKDRWFFLSTREKRILDQNYAQTMVYEGNATDNLVKLIDKLISFDGLDAHSSISRNLKECGKTMIMPGKSMIMNRN